jgi:hypothetical protein
MEPTIVLLEKGASQIGIGVLLLEQVLAGWGRGAEEVAHDELFVSS